MNEHFGSGRLESDSNGSKKTWKERMEEIMIESKKRKYERKLEKDRAQEMTESVDAEWKDIMHLVAGVSGVSAKGNGEHKESSKTTADEYDMAVNSLKYDARALAGDKIEDEEEAKQKKIKQRMEERDKRMKLMSEEEAQGKVYASVDDLDDNFALDNGSNVSDEDKEDTLSQNEDQDDDEQSNEEEEDKEFDSPQILGDNVLDEEEIQENDNQEDDEEDYEDDDEDDPLQNLSDLESDISDDNAIEDVSDSTLKSDSILISDDFKSIFTSVQTGGFSVSDFKSKLSGIQAKGKSLVSDAVAICKEFCQKGNIPFLNTLSPFIFELTEKNPKLSTSCFIKHLTEMKTSLLDGKISNPAEVILFIKFIVNIFPASDARHCVITPAGILLSYILKTIRIKSLQQVFLALLGCSIALEYSERARRVCPEAMNILNAILRLCIPECSFPYTSGKRMEILQVKDNAKIKNLDEKERVDMKFVLFSFYGSVGDDKHKGLAILSTIKLLRKFVECFPKNIGAAEAFWEPILQTCIAFDKSNNHSSLKARVKHLANKIKECYPSKLSTLKRDKQPPVMLQMLEPKFENVEEVGRSHKNNKGKSREKIEREILQARVKKEKKGAIRELRRDASFLAKKRLEEEINKDKIRKAKVKRIFSQLAQQEGDYNALQKKKKS